MTQKISVQDGNIIYVASDTTKSVNFDILGTANVTQQLTVGNNSSAPGTITTFTGQDLIVTTGSGGNLRLSPNGSILLNNVAWPSGPLSLSVGQYLGISSVNQTQFYPFVYAFTGSDILQTVDLNNLYPGITAGQCVVGPTVIYECVSAGVWRTTSAPLGYVPLNKAGDSMTGYLILNANPVSSLGAATKQYVDNVASGINIHQSVATSTTSTSNLSSNFYTPGTSGPPPDTGTGVGGTLTSTTNVALGTIGGYSSLLVNDRVLVNNQSNQTQNGIYIVTQLGSGSTPWILTRASDYNNSVPGEVHAGDLTFIQNGTLAGTQWVQVNSGTGVNNSTIIDTDPIVFSQYSSAGAYTSGSGINIASNVISNTGVLSNVAGSGISISNTTGNITITNTGVLSLIAGTGISISGSTGSITVSKTSTSKSTTSTIGPVSTTESYISNNTFSLPSYNVGTAYKITLYGTCTSTVAGNISTFNIRYGTTGTLSDSTFYTTTLLSSSSGTNIPFVAEFVIVITDPTNIYFSTTGSLMNQGTYGYDTYSSGISTNSANVFSPGISSALSHSGTNYLGISYVSSALTTSCIFNNIVVQLL